MSRHGTARQSLDWDVPRVEQNGTGDEQRRIEGDERSEAERRSGWAKQRCDEKRHCGEGLRDGEATPSNAGAEHGTDWKWMSDEKRGLGQAGRRIAMAERGTERKRKSRAELRDGEAMLCREVEAP